MTTLQRWFLGLVLGFVCVWSASAQFGIPGIPSVPGLPTGDVDAVKTAQGAGNLAKGIAGIGAKEEAAIGGSVAVAIVSNNGGVWKNEEATKRVATIGKALVRYSIRANSPFVFGVLNSEGIEGASAPGGYVFVSKGLYEMAKDDDELAGVLAHEIAHVTNRHALKIVSQSKMTKGFVQVASGAAGAGSFGAFDDVIGNLVQSGFNVTYNTNTEHDADHTGREIADAAGFDRNGLRRFLVRLYEMKKGEAYAFSKHPPLKHRLERLEK